MQKIIFLTIILFSFMSLNAQKILLEKFPELPDELGFAGMFAGVSNGNIFCMGGANFPDKKPWEGGQKIWHKSIYMFEKGKWKELKEKLPEESAYGVSGTYNEKIIIAGGNNQAGFSNKVFSFSWENGVLQMEQLADLPYTLANMCGTIVGDLMIITGGQTSASSPAINDCIALELKVANGVWFKLSSIPGPSRLLPVCATYNNSYYVFSGETTSQNVIGQNYRDILLDAYSFTPVMSSNSWSGVWKKLTDMPKGVSAGGSPLPVLPGKGMIFWGGVDAVTALWKDPGTHEGISKKVIAYHPENDSWTLQMSDPEIDARVTLPVVKWNNRWLYISGEIKPGVRTNTNYTVH